MTDIALIGTAGRGREHHMTKALWKKMLANAKQQVNPNDHVYSGGAAWGDHLSVALYLMGHIDSLTLYLPAPLLATGRYEGREKTSAGWISNLYHDKFSQVLGIDSMAEILEAKNLGAQIFEEPRSDNSSPFFVRNTKVAKSVQKCVAYTWGEGNEPMDGGTKNTWSQVKGARIHISLGRLEALE